MYAFFAIIENIENTMNIVWKFWFKHNKCWANLASSKNVNLRILVASSFSGECEKCRKGAREKEREKERSMRYSFCFHNRIASSTWRPLHVSKSSLLFLSTVSLDFFSFARRFTVNVFGSFLFGLSSFLLPEDRGRQDWLRKFEESNHMIFI